MVSPISIERMTLAVEGSKELGRRLARELRGSAAPPGEDLPFWLDRSNRPLHPSTPTIEIGLRNRNQVLYVPADPARKLPQQTLVTLTSPDAMANGVDIWGVMRRLNRWALDAQIADPTSLRPQLRLETNSRVLQGSITLGCTPAGRVSHRAAVRHRSERSRRGR